MMGDAISDIELDRILSIVDSDMSGEIAFSEFTIACLDPSRIINNDTLRRVFNLFDADRSGTLTMQEIKLAICAGRNLDDRVWLAAVNSGFDEKAIAGVGNNTTGNSFTLNGMTMGGGGPNGPNTQSMMGAS